MGEDVQMDLSKFEVDMVGIDVKIDMIDTKEQKLTLTYSGVGNTLDEAVDGCTSAITTLVGFLEARRPS